MAIVPCPSCTAPMRVREEMLGRLAKCPTCGHVFSTSASAGPGMPLLLAVPVPTPAPAASPDDLDIRRFYDSPEAWSKTRTGMNLSTFAALLIFLVASFGVFAWIAMALLPAVTLRQIGNDPSGGLGLACIGIIGLVLLAVACLSQIIGQFMCMSAPVKHGLVVGALGGVLTMVWIFIACLAVSFAIFARLPRKFEPLFAIAGLACLLLTPASTILWTMVHAAIADHFRARSTKHLFLFFGILSSAILFSLILALFIAAASRPRGNDLSAYSAICSFFIAALAGWSIDINRRALRLIDAGVKKPVRPTDS